MSKRRSLVTLSVAAAALLGLTFVNEGCQSGGGNASAPKTDTVIIEGMAFNPADLTVNEGDTVLFINKDIVTHTATSQPDSTKWNSGDLNPGDSWSFVPTESSDYYCYYHPTMLGKITVVKK